MQERMRLIGILGGSFNPPHVGHTAICKWAKETLGAEEVWVIPCFDHPFDKEMASFDERFAMCEAAFKSLDYVQITDVEKRLGGKSITVRTLEKLRDENDDSDLILLVGSDVDAEMPSWHDSERIKKLARIEVVPRGADSFIPNVSSTEIRKKIREGGDISGMVEDEVLKYIVKNNMYR